MSYRYWSFVEAHHSHILLPPSASLEAVEILSWSHTSQHSSHAPLLDILMSVGTRLLDSFINDIYSVHSGGMQGATEHPTII